MVGKLGAAVGEAEARKPSRQASYIPTGSPRDLIPRALVHVLTTLIEECPEVASSTRAELRTIKFRLCRLFKLNDLMGPANATDVAQGLADDDGEEIES